MRATTALQPVPFRLQPLAFVDLQARRTAEVLSIIRAAILGDYSPSTSFSVADSRHKSDRPKAILAIDICQCARPGPSPSLDTCLSPLASYAFPRRPHDGRFHEATRLTVAFATSAAVPARRRRSDSSWNRHRVGRVFLQSLQDGRLSLPDAG